MSEYSIFTSESVSEGHPDKIADQISDAVLDAIITEDKARVACRKHWKTGVAIIAGEISPAPGFDFEQLVRDVIVILATTILMWVMTAVPAALSILLVNSPWISRKALTAVSQKIRCR